MDPEGSPADNNAEMTSRSGGSPPHTMKKGPWTSTEDAILMEYVKKHGEGNWNAVRRNTGLMRCGKSCRLRWTNHLRPNLKKGAFSSEEEALIVELHAKLGNKWSRMASLLPGRTDNEIKNYWNTRLKRRQRAGLPVYPPDTNPQNHHQQENPQTNLTSSSLVSLLSSRQGQESGYRTPISIFDMFSSPTPMSNSQNQIKSSYLSDPNQHFKIVHDKNGVALSLSSFKSPFPSISASLAFKNQGIAPPGPSLSMPVNFINFRIENSAPVSQASLEQNGQNAIGSGTSMELPSIPSLVPETTTTPTSSGSDYLIATTSDADDHDETHGQGLLHVNSGLFDDLADEAQALTHSEKKKEISLDIDRSQGKFLWDYRLTEDADGSGRDESGLNVILDQQYEESFPGHSIIRTKTTNTSSLESNPLDDDFLSLLDMSDWCDGNGNNTNGQSSNSNGGDAGMESDQPGPSYSPAGATSEKTNINWAAGASCWENMPGNY